MRKFIALLGMILPLVSFAQQTQTQYITGKGLGDTQTWDFYCTDGMKSKKWSKIEVPSQWELQGFGEYSYGRWYTDKSIKNPPMEQGFYKRTFNIPSSWKGQQIEIVLEGVMTDAEVKINGTLAGDIHQGAFNRFSYDITDKVKTGRNTIEVNVSKESANRLVNAAERKADWWIFGGIYRPVYITAKPKVNIGRVATYAKADGDLYAEVYTTPVADGYSLKADVAPLKGGETLGERTFSLTANGDKHIITAKWDGVKNWDVEHPNLYVLTLSLVDAGGKTVHTTTERIGFRTVEFRKQDGVYVNGTKVVLKGINRHSFHPDGGRTTNRATSLMDAKLIKEMNMNAVRFHYAPDTHFLEMCDSLGIFVMNELAGWQNSYDTKVGSKLVKEFITRDVNHPSIIIWSNGNEGGWNAAIDPMFAQYDPHKRHVVHPWADFNDLDTHHYPTFLTGVGRFVNGYKVFMPTEFMHGTYDQGHGAGLEDFWNNYTSHPLFGGGFMWDFCDNAVKRTDKGGILDSDGSNGSDGILGPRREKEGSYWAVREIWAPIKFDKIYITPSFKGELPIKNTYLYTNLSECNATYRVISASSPLNGAKAEVVAEGEVVLPALEPGDAGKAKFKMPANFFDGDILEIKAWDASGEEMCTWTWTTRYNSEYVQREMKNLKSSGQTALSWDNDKVVVAGDNVLVTFDKKTGYLTSVKNGKGVISLNNGPVPVGMNARLKSVLAYRKDGNAYFTAYYQGAVDSIQWCMTPSGMLSMRSVMLNRGNGGQGFDDAVVVENILNLGLTFSYPEDKVKSMSWFGRGPYRVWKNRVAGSNYGVWGKDYNTTVTGESFENLVYPEFKGYHGNLYWSTFNTTESQFTVYSETDGVYMCVFTPDPAKNNRTTTPAYPEFPKGDISFLLEIPGIRCFKPISQHGPKSQPGDVRIKIGDEGLKINLWFDFR